MIIYEITNLINGKKYIGKDRKNNPTYLGSGTALLRAVKKYGRKNFNKRIIEKCKDLEHLDEREIYWVDYFNAVKSRKYYNIKRGGSGGPTPKHYTNEFRQKMSELEKGENNPMFNKNHKEESIELMKQKAIGRWTLEWFIEKYGEIKGQQKYDKRNKKLSEDRKGEKNPFYGKAFPYEEHPRYTHVPKEKLLELIRQGKSSKEIAKHFDTTITTIRRKVKRYWNCNLTEFKRKI